MEGSVVQLQLLELKIEKREVRVPMDAGMQLELIEMMASILVADFKRRKGKSMNQVLCSPKITPKHLACKALVYLRQSSDKPRQHR
jgi:hypothetical protein